MHECRHTFASMLIDTGARPKGGSGGHRSLGDPDHLDLYGHLLPGSRDEVRSSDGRLSPGDGESLWLRHPSDWRTTGAPPGNRPFLGITRSSSAKTRRMAGRAIQQKTPLRGGGALLGLLQGGEICISIYVDPWEVGEPSCVVGARCGKQRGPYVRRGTQPKSFCVAPSSVSPLESLNSVRTYVRFVCECDHRDPLFGGISLLCGNGSEPNRAPWTDQMSSESLMLGLRVGKRPAFGASL